MSDVDLWGQITSRKAHFFVFHDESIPNKRWFLIGLLFVCKNDLEKARKALRCHRIQEDYWGEVHFSALPKSFDGPHSAKARVARAWMQAFESGLSEITRFTCLAVDRQSPAYDHKRFTKDYHAYNRFTAMALKAGIAWFLTPENFDALKITFVSDLKDRMSRPDEGWIDNFEEYLPYRAELDTLLGRLQGKPYPKVDLDVSLEESSANDLLQFCDLLLGATQTALVAKANRPVKRNLGAMVVRWLQDLERPLYEQRFGLHRRFNLWGFPDPSGKPYAPLEPILRVNDGQLELFSQAD